MLRSANKRIAVLWTGMAMLGCTVAQAGPSAMKVPAVKLPPLAVVIDHDASGETWRETGTISGSIEVTRKNFKRCFGHQGWSLKQTIPLANKKRRSEIHVWKRGEREMLLMLWQERPGKSGFSWGISK